MDVLNKIFPTVISEIIVQMSSPVVIIVAQLDVFDGLVYMNICRNKEELIKAHEAHRRYKGCSTLGDYRGSGKLVEFKVKLDDLLGI